MPIKLSASMRAVNFANCSNSIRYVHKYKYDYYVVLLKFRPKIYGLRACVLNSKWTLFHIRFVFFSAEHSKLYLEFCLSLILLNKKWNVNVILILFHVKFVAIYLVGVHVNDWMVQTSNASQTCQICGGYRLMPCPSCSGSKKSLHRNHFTTEFVALKCMNCDEVGLVKCYNCN